MGGYYENSALFICIYHLFFLSLYQVKQLINKTMKATNIKWNCKDDVLEYNIDECDLPTEVELPNNINVFDVAGDLSDNYGFLVISFDFDE